MPGKKKGKSGGKGKSKSSKGKSGGGKKKGSKGKKGKGKGSKLTSEKKAQPVPDPFSVAAMLNAYYISHGPVEFLAFRGYTWAGGDGGKKKKKGKKKK